MFPINLFLESRQNALKWGKGFCFLKHDVRIKMSHIYKAGQFPTVEAIMKFLFEIYPDIPPISEKTFRLVFILTCYQKYIYDPCETIILYLYRYPKPYYVI